jgi:hypothetical protein
MRHALGLVEPSLSGTRFWRPAVSIDLGSRDFPRQSRQSHGPVESEPIGFMDEKTFTRNLICVFIAVNQLFTVSPSGNRIV